MRCSRLRRGVVASGDEVGVDLGRYGGGVVVGDVVVEVVTDHSTISTHPFVCVTSLAVTQRRDFPPESDLV